MNNPNIKQAENEPKRENWIDCVKGIAILLIIWGHTQNSPSALNTWVQNFRVAIFLVVSGYLFAKRGKTIASYSQTVKKMLKPYICFSILAIICNAVYLFHFHLPIGKDALIGLYKTISLYGISALWYLPSYTLATLIVLKTKTRLDRCIISVLGILISIAYNFFYLVFVWNSETCFSLFYYPTAAIIRGCACASIISIGYEVYYLFENAKKHQIILLSILSITISVVFSSFNTYANFSEVNYFPHPLLLYLCFISGSFGFVSLFYVLSKFSGYLRLLQFCGRHSLILLVTHTTFKLDYISVQIIRKMVGFQISHVWVGFLSLLLIMLIEIPIIYILTKTPLKKIIS